MTSRDFCYWLQGYFEIKGTEPGAIKLEKPQVDLIKKHLHLVFKHEIDPSYGNQEHQNNLNSIHNSDPPDGPLIRC